MIDSKERITFTLMDAGIKSVGPVEVYDDRTLDANGNIILFYCHLKRDMRTLRNLKPNIEIFY